MQKYLIVIIFCLTACVSDKTQTRVSIQHLESLYEVNPDKVSLDSLQKEYGYFWEVYRQYILFFF